ncbi:IPT/TIG domain-containing protein [Chryseolinea lacunae]|uniref:IPT/TIG domain-containing protein n=1 Tax=Chryseolinea lacunae TaxID=2801331 RepID=A0ABS1KZ00_9BACT|nr:IPT/TIG domain-containing protein [Chryseolinea lacunae]MBL0744619.1 IPT/TIG domain-containing protein [Chryseolinea lacunae]
MRHTEKIFLYLCLLGTALTLNSLFWSCTKNDEEEIPLQITAIAPTKGPYLTVVTITGVGFSANPADNEVTLNGKVAVVRAATATQLLAEVPKAAGTGAVAVKRGVRTVTGPSFEYTPSLWVSTLAGSTEGYEDGPGIQAKFGLIAGLAMDAQGNVYAADKLNHCIRKITPEDVGGRYHAGRGRWQRGGSAI